jgi:hypothetical protein
LFYKMKSIEVKKQLKEEHEIALKMD